MHKNRANIEDFRSWGVKELGSSASTGTSPYYPNSLTLQLQKSEIFVKVFVCGAERTKTKQKLRISGVAELRS